MSAIEVVRDDIESVGDVATHVYISFVQTVITVSRLERGVPKIVDMIIHDDNTQQKFIASLNQHLSKDSVILYDAYAPLPSAVRGVLDALPVKKYGVTAKKAPLVCLYNCIYLVNMTSLLSHALTLSTIEPDPNLVNIVNTGVREQRVTASTTTALTGYLKRLEEGTLMPSIGLGVAGLPFGAWSKMINNLAEDGIQHNKYSGSLSFVRKALIIATDASFHKYDKTEACIGIVSMENDFMHKRIKDPKQYAEVLAIIKALYLCRNIKRDIVILSDSKNAVNLVNQVFGAPGKINLNNVHPSVLQQLIYVRNLYNSGDNTRRKVVVAWVKGHNNDMLNEAAHALAIRLFRESHFQRVTASLSWQGTVEKGTEWDFCKSRVGDYVEMVDSKVKYKKNLIQRLVGHPVFYRGQLFYGKLPITNPRTVQQTTDGN